MPRLNKDDVETREKFALELFKANPKMSAAAANKEIKHKFNKVMRNKRVYELRAMAQTMSKDRADISAGLKPSGQMSAPRAGVGAHGLPEVQPPSQEFRALLKELVREVFLESLTEAQRR